MSNELSRVKAEATLLHILQHVTMSAARKKTFSLRASKEGREELARIFRAMAASEEAQARRALYLLHGPIGESGKNIEEIGSHQLPELQDMYRRLQYEAEQSEAASLLHLAEQEGRVGRKNAVLLKKAANKEAAPSYFVCSFCGYVHENEAPENCPVCQAPKRRFCEI